MAFETVTVTGLRAYLSLTAGDAADGLLAPALDGAKAFVARNYPAAAVAPVGADVIDAVYTLAARRYHERNSGYADALDSGVGAVWARALPVSVRVVLESYRPQSFIG
jgi:hypothetical protein